MDSWRRARGQLAPTAVDGIADDRISDVREMHADLMRTPGLEPDPRERVRAVLLLDAVVSDRRAPVATHGHLDALRAMAADRLVDGTAAGHDAETDREILALDLVRGEHGDERGVNLERARDD